MRIGNFNLAILFLFITVYLSGCTSTRVAGLTVANSENLELYTTKMPQRDYVELYYIQTDGGIFQTPQSLLNGLKKKAVEIGADAIINIKYDFQAWYPIVSGIAVKYK